MRKYFKISCMIIFLILFSNNTYISKSLAIDNSTDIIEENKDLDIDTESGDKNINIKFQLTDNNGNIDDLPKEFIKTYIIAIPSKDTKIDELLDLDFKEYFKIENANFIYTLKDVKIGNLVVTMEDIVDKKTLEQLNLNGDYNIFKDVEDIVLNYEVEGKEKEETIEIKIVGKDEVHKDIGGKKNDFKIKVKYRGNKEDIDIKKEIINEDSIKFFIEETDDIKVLEDEKYKIVNFTGYNIKEIKEKEKYKYEILLNPKFMEDLSDKERIIIDYGVRDQLNIVKNYIFILDKNDKFYLKDKDITDFLDVRVINRLGLNEEKRFFYNDQLEITIKYGKEKEFVRTVFGDRYRFVEKNTITNFINENKEKRTGVTIDYARKKYRVKVNNEEVKEYDVMLEDTEYLVFENEKIESIKIDKNGEILDIKDKKITLNELDEKDTILLSTSDKKPLKEIFYHVENIDYNSYIIGKNREFKGIEGTRLKVKYIKEYEDEKLEGGNFKNIIGDYEKEIVLKEFTKSKFIFKTNKDKFVYKVIHQTKYGDNNIDGEVYDIDNILDENTKILTETEYIELGKNSNINIKPKDFDDGFKLIDKNHLPFSDEKPYIEGRENDKYRGFKIKYVSEEISEKLNEDTVYIYSYKQIDKEKIETVSVNIVEIFDDYGKNEINLKYPRFKENYKVKIADIGKRHSGYEKKFLIEHFDDKFGIVKGSTKFINGDLEFEIKGTGNEETDLFPKLPKSFRMKRSVDFFKDSIEINYSNKIEGEKEREENFEKAIVNIKVGSFDNGLTELNYPVEVYEGIIGYKLEIDRLKIENLKNEHINIDKDIYIFKPYEKNGDLEVFRGIIDEDGNQMIVDGKILGLETNFIDLKKSEQNVYINYSKNNKDYELEIDQNFRLYNYYIIPKEIPKFYEQGNKIVKDEEEIKELYNDYIGRVDTYFDIDTKLIELNKILHEHFQETKEVQTNDVLQITMSKDLEKYRLSVKNNIENKKFQKDLLEEINRLNTLNENRFLTTKYDESTDYKDSPIRQFDKIRTSFYMTINSNAIENKKNLYNVGLFQKYGNDKIIIKGKEGYFIDLNENNNDVLYDFNRDDELSKSKDIGYEDYSDTHRYKITRKSEIIGEPISISEIINDNKDIMDFLYFNDDFKLGETTNWNKKENNTLTLSNDNNLSDLIPIVSIIRQYDVYTLEEIPGIDDGKISEDKEEVKGKNLDIIVRVFDEKDENIKEITIVSYKDLPRYFAQLGWVIYDYKGFEYINDEGFELVSGDVKYSGELEEDTTNKLYLDYKQIDDVEIPEKPELKLYKYTILNQEIDMNGIKNISTFKSNKDYPVGTRLKIEPKEIEGYRLDSSKEEEEIEIKDEDRLGLNSNYHYFQYTKLSNIKKIIFNGNGGKVDEKENLEIEVLKGTKIKEIEKPLKIERENYIFKGWYNKALDKKIDEEKIVEEDIEIYAKWEEIEQPKEEKIKIIFNGNGGKVDEKENLEIEVLKGTKIKEIEKPLKIERENYIFKGWYNKALDKKIDEEKIVEEDIEIYAKWEEIKKEDTNSSSGGSSSSGGRKRDRKDKSESIEEDRIENLKAEDIIDDSELMNKHKSILFELNKKEHFAYLKGYESDRLEPEKNITREEVASVFSRIIIQDEIKTRDNFKDIEIGRWSEKAINNLAELDIIRGYKDGEFKPMKNITRAEVASIMSNFADVKVLETEFPDIINHWAENDINIVRNKGWIKGYNDGSFKPEQLLTRAEFVTMINSLLDRKVKKENMLEGLKQFSDLKEDKWYYEEMIEATNGHDYENQRLEDGSEKWIKLLER